MASQAIGWKLEVELKEIERVVKPNGRAIHLFKNPDSDNEIEKTFYDLLASSDWRYE